MQINFSTHPFLKRIIWKRKYPGSKSSLGENVFMMIKEKYPHTQWADKKAKATQANTCYSQGMQKSISEHLMSILEADGLKQQKTTMGLSRICWEQGIICK